MKKAIAFLFGILSCLIYVEITAEETKTQLYGSRDIQAELKINVDRANVVLDAVEKKYIKKNVPKPDIPKPEITCKCNGTGVILQADGNRSQCSCFASPQGCKCKPQTEAQQ